MRVFTSPTTKNSSQAPIVTRIAATVLRVSTAIKVDTEYRMVKKKVKMGISNSSQLAQIPERRPQANQRPVTANAFTSRIKVSPPTNLNASSKLRRTGLTSNKSTLPFCSMLGMKKDVMITDSNTAIHDPIESASWAMKNNWNPSGTSTSDSGTSTKTKLGSCNQRRSMPGVR